MIEAALAAPGFAADAPAEDDHRRLRPQRRAGRGRQGRSTPSRQGQIRHFFLVGGCDGAKPGRNYYTEFAQKVPDDCVILTLACGKYRFNKLEFGDDRRHSAAAGHRPVQRRLFGDPDRRGPGRGLQLRRQRPAAVAGAELVRAEGGGHPADAACTWASRTSAWAPACRPSSRPAVLSVLVEKFNIAPITTPEEDLAAMLN